MMNYRVRRDQNGEVHWTAHTDISPTGFETGYGGAGPYDLAASILGDILGKRPDLLDKTLVEAFLGRFIVPQKIAHGQAYVISGGEIEEWLKENGLSPQE